MSENAIKTHRSFEKTFEYILAISDMPRDDLPVRVLRNWDAVAAIAEQLKIYGYLVPWVLETWGEYCDQDMRDRLIGTIFRNKIRNRNMLEQIYRLSALFDTHDVPVLFLKGAAGLVQNLYPAESRFLADIDILVQNGYMERGEELLRANGFVRDDSVRVPPYHHHTSLYRHPEYPGAVELHYEPYDFSMLDRPVMPGIRERARRLEPEGRTIAVPSMDDHIWITLRSHGYSKGVLPRFHEALELLAVQHAGHAIDYGLLRRRCGDDMIPFLLDGVLFTLHRYFGVEPPVQYRVPDAWVRWSDEMNRRIFVTGHEETAPEKRFSCLRFLNDGTLYQKMRLFSKLARYEVQEDMAAMHLTGSHSKVLLAYRYARNVLLLLWLHVKFNMPGGGRNSV